jgi:hypothetical protein
MKMNFHYIIVLYVPYFKETCNVYRASMRTTTSQSCKSYGDIVVTIYDINHKRTTYQQSNNYIYLKTNKINKKNK